MIATARTRLAEEAATAATSEVGSRVGWAALIALSSGAGLLCIGLADEESRLASDAALPLFWLGILGLFAPLTWWLLARTSWLRLGGRDASWPGGMTIAAAYRAPIDASVAVAGVVVSAPGALESGRTVYLEDRTGGIAIWFEGAPPVIEPGLAVAVSGRLVDRHGERTVRVAARDLRFIGPADVPPPIAVMTSEVDERFVGRRVIVEGRVVGRARRSGDALRFAVDDGTGPVDVTAAPRSLRGVRVGKGSRVRISGSVSRGRARRGATNGYRILPTLGTDVLLAEVAGDALRASAGRHPTGLAAGGSDGPVAVGPGSRRLALGMDRPVIRFGPSRDERLWLVLGLGIALYVVRLMVSPTGFRGPDEFSHWRTLEDIIRSGHLFSPNPLLQVSSIYPGLEAATATAMVSSGVDVFPAAVILIGLARLVTVLAVFLLAARITGSSRTASVASILYMANPSFLAFDATFSYESLALPLALVAIWATLRWADRRGRSLLYGSVAIGAIAATAATHHLTSLVLLGFLSAWAVLSFVRDRRTRTSWPIAVAALFTLACIGLWLAIAGTFALTYLTGILGGGLNQLLAVLSGAGEAKQLFVARAGFAAPLPEVVVAYAAVGLLVLSLPLVLWHALRAHRPSAIELVLVLGALAYPGSLALRLTPAGSEASQRASEFLFLSLAILGADWLVGLRHARFRPPRAVAFAAILVVVAGGIVAGNPLVQRLPGPYHVAAEGRSIEPEGQALAAWALEELGPGNPLIADRTNAKLLGSMGLQDPVMSANSHLGTAYVMYARTLGPTHIETLRQGGVRYIVVDLRLARDVPVYAYVFEQAEPNAGNHTTPMPLEALQKWDSLPGVERIYDSGDLVVYDIQAFVDAQP